MYEFENLKFLEKSMKWPLFSIKLRSYIGASFISQQYRLCNVQTETESTTGTYRETLYPDSDAKIREKGLVTFGNFPICAQSAVLILGRRILFTKSAR